MAVTETQRARRNQASTEPSVRAHAALPTGVHAIPDAQAAELIRGSLSATKSEPAPLVWIDISNPGEKEEAFLRDEMGLHPLAVEDTVRGRQRPKLDRYPKYLFLVLYAASINPERRRMALNEMHIFLGEGFIITVHDYRVQEVGEIIARWRTTPTRFPDVGYLAHALLDAVVDDYFPVLEHFVDRGEEIENAIFEELAEMSMHELLRLRHELMTFRRVVAPARDVLSSLLRRDLPFLRPELRLYLHDVHDHTIRVTEGIDALRELLAAAMEAQLTMASNQLNQSVRMLTGWSIILMSMALVAGIYGMNFAFMPELEWRWGYFGALTLMATVGTSLVLFFRRRGWL